MVVNLQFFGGRGSASGMGDSPEQKARREASELLKSNGFNRYDKIAYTDHSNAATDHYFKMQNDLQDGNTLKNRFSAKTGNEILDMVKEDRIRNAKRILSSDLSDKAATKEYGELEKRLKKIEEYVKQTSRRKR